MKAIACFPSLGTLCKPAVMALSLLWAAGCVSARLPSGPDVYAAKTYPDAPKVAVANCQDVRSSERIGSVGLASISVRKPELANLANKYILECLNQELGVNVERVSAESPEEAKTLAQSAGVDAALFASLTELTIASADAAMDPARVGLEGEVWIFDALGRQVFHESVTVDYTEWIGFKLVDKATGRLVDAAARRFAHQLGSRLHAEGVLKQLKKSE
jgi:hypothetical protein